MSWESQLNRNEMARQSAALSKVAQGLDDLSETVRSSDDLRRQLADAKAENERLRQELAEARCALSGMEAAWEPVEELMFPEEATDEVPMH